MIALTTATIDLVAAEASLHADTAGGLVTFAGTVRNHNKGREVLYLEYEAYAEMAVAQLERIAATIRQRWPVQRVTLIHRTGRLEIGEVAVFVGIAATHRDTAFDAARYGIDAVKAEVPIWKREVFVGGEVWVDDCCSSGQHDRLAPQTVTAV
ncbi:MAG: molybdenum cofactor biosynthesis protein MoaE [Candidatus Sericytochromatia bacterium]|nr:molybdenum cofactor biosynthesis protein MoaE [Candidatus Sericytochromatia bacterium]